VVTTAGKVHEVVSRGDPAIERDSGSALAEISAEEPNN
jgi:hypothetical protein